MLSGLGLDFKYLELYNQAVIDTLARADEELSHVSLVGTEHLDQARDLKSRFSRVPIVHHLSNVEPAGLTGLNRSRAEFLNEITAIFESPWCGEDIGVWSLNEAPLPYFAGPPYTCEMAEFVASNIRELQQISSVPFLAEVPSVGIVMGDISPGQFFTILSERTGCGIVLDLSHVYSHAVATGEDSIHLLRDFPLASVVEIHIAGGKVRDGQFPRYIDSHSHPIPEDVFRLLEFALPITPNCRAVTYEIGVELSSADFATDFARLRNALTELKFIPRLVS